MNQSALHMVNNTTFQQRITAAGYDAKAQVSPGPEVTPRIGGLS
jgi:hypothetical protein